MCGSDCDSNRTRSPWADPHLRRLTFYSERCWHTRVHCTKLPVPVTSQRLADGSWQRAKTSARCKTLGTPLHWAAMKGRLEVAEVSLPRAPRSTSRQERCVSRSAYGGARWQRRRGRPSGASGAEIEARNAKGTTPLHVAANTGHIAVAETLVAFGADLNGQNEFSMMTPITLAGDASHFDIVDLLIAHGVSAPPVEPIVGLLAGTDPEKGRAVFLGCAPCHTIAKNDTIRSGGPNLWGVLERGKASWEALWLFSRIHQARRQVELRGPQRLSRQPRRGFAPGTRYGRGPGRRGCRRPGEPHPLPAGERRRSSAPPGIGAAAYADCPQAVAPGP